MFKVTVLKMKDIVKVFVGISITTVMIIMFSKNFRKSTDEKNKLFNLQLSLNSLIKVNGIECVDEVLPSMASINGKDNFHTQGDNLSEESDLKDDGKKDKNILHQVLNTQISLIDGIEKSEAKAQEKNLAAGANEENEENAVDANNNQNQAEVEMAKTGLETQVITNNPISDNSNVQYGNIKIKNETSYVLTEDILNPDVTIENKNIVLFHTHSCESYTPSEKYPYQETGTFRTTDLDFSVTRVGTELENQLKQYNYNVIHSTDYHDYPAYNGSYTRSLATVENILQTTPADIIMDVHRDAIGSRSDYAPTVKIGDSDEAAQIMFVIGTNDGGLWHPNWQQNLKFAIKIQQKAEEMYPGLFKPMMLTKSRYNQHTR